jgi:hypothetical protein
MTTQQIILWSCAYLIELGVGHAVMRLTDGPSREDRLRNES